MTWADNVNGIYEMGGALALAYNCWTTYKDKQIKGLSIASMIFFTTWGFWNLYYYPSLNQMMSTVGASALVFFNTIWLGQAIYYTKRKEAVGFKIAIAKFWDAVGGTENMMKEFDRDFPGKCIICSFQRFGYANGYTDDPIPPVHVQCPERSPWSPELQSQINKVHKMGEELQKESHDIHNTTRSNRCL